MNERDRETERQREREIYRLVYPPHFQSWCKIERRASTRYGNSPRVEVADFSDCYRHADLIKISLNEQALLFSLQLTIRTGRVLDASSEDVFGSYMSGFLFPSSSYLQTGFCIRLLMKTPMSKSTGLGFVSVYVVGYLPSSYRQTGSESGVWARRYCLPVTQPRRI